MPHYNYILFLLLVLLLPPPYAEAQSLDQFKANSGEFTPSTIIVIIIGIIFLLTGFLAVFLRQFSDGCFGLSIVPPNPEVTADGCLVTRGLDTDVINSLPTYFYSDVKQHRQGKVELECAVCLCEFHDTEALRLLPGCSHVFHPRCIDIWLASHVTCPICRQSLLAPHESAEPTKPHALINIPQASYEADGLDDATSHDVDEEYDRDHDEAKENEKEDKKRIVGKFPRSHSTGHSMPGSERFTLRLPEEVQNSLVNRASYAGEGLSPPPVNSQIGMVRSGVSASLTGPGSKNLKLQPVKTSEHLWPI